MSKRRRPRQRVLEVNVMYEPHRLQHELLRQAYAWVLPESRRRLLSGNPSLDSMNGAITEGTERKSA
jgi:hypothetical protein